MFGTMELRVKYLDSRAQMPRKSTEGAAGYDISSVESCVVPAGGKALIPTGLAIAVPQGTYGRIAPRSGLAAKHSIGVGAGVIDRDYTGHVHVVLFNHGSTEYEVRQGDRVAQLILERIVDDATVVCVDDLEETGRGVGGFGSTGA